MINEETIFLIVILISFLVVVNIIFKKEKENTYHLKATIIHNGDMVYYKYYELEVKDGEIINNTKNKDLFDGLTAYKLKVELHKE